MGDVVKSTRSKIKINTHKEKKKSFAFLLQQKYITL